MAIKPMKIGVIGAGQISNRYLGNAKNFPAFEVAAVADLRVDAAQERAAEYGVPKGCSVDELLADPEIELVLNITSHSAHAKVGMAVVEAGKHVYTEKPFVVYREDGLKLLAKAEEMGVRTGGAPDTFFGSAWQTARKLIDDGEIGEVIGAWACLQNARKPGFAAKRPQNTDGYVSFYRTHYWEYGAGASFDRGPYYLNALIHLLGPVKRVQGSVAKPFEERDRAGTMYKVNAPTHVVGLMDFANGAICQFTMTEDVYSTGMPHVEIYGTEGSLRIIDPNIFMGDIFVRRPDSPELELVPPMAGFEHEARGAGIADMATAIRNGRPHRASGAMAFHVVDIITAIHEASERGQAIELTTTCDQPAAFPAGLPDWTVDD